MQNASTTPVPPQNGYQPLSEAEIYAVKKQYLALLPPQQIIDTCLTFEAHAPLHIKSSVWPYDIRAAIASILAQKAQVAQTQTSPDLDIPSKTSVPDPDSSSGEKTTPQADSSQQSTATTIQPPSNTSGSVSQRATSQIPAATPGPHYPHQPYYHPTYSHPPYYAVPHPYGYPHPYPPYPQPPAMYPANPPGQHPPLFTNTPLVHSPHPAPESHPSLNNADDLPSYEEMIVEALLDSGAPDGCAPKNLFTWMATHYPLQTNFRPSASQALQKAYRRGRLEKGSNGKYRLNESWEGGNTTRRTTRRPQILAQTTMNGTQQPSSPFTHAPLVPHGATNSQTRPPPPGQPPGYGGYPFGYPYQGIPGSAHPPAASSATSQKQAANAVDYETREGNDAWEAAQNILKAINFGRLFQISNEEVLGDETSTTAHPVNLATSTGGSDQPSALRAVMAEQAAGKSGELNAEQRAALQAQLALLAAQLAELADVSEDELSHNLEVPKSSAVSTTCAPLAQGGRSGDEEDMLEVPVPATSLVA